MSQLVSIRTNISYIKKGEEYTKVNELVFLVDKANYGYTNEGQVIRQRGLEEFRFEVGEKAFEQMLELLHTIKDANETDLE